MTIRADGVSAVSVGELLQEDLRIPDYQRPYRWRPSTALQLVQDLRQAQVDPIRQGHPYVLGAVILHAAAGVNEPDGGGPFDVVDGQQRLVTLRLILDILHGAPVPAGLDEAVETPGGSADPRQQLDSPLRLAYRELKGRLADLTDAERGELGKFIRDRCQVIRVVTADLDEAFRVFDSQNYRGRPLDPHDLLKAHHLREMRDETPAMKAAVVEAWESVESKELDRLFSMYLYRIVQWVRGERAPEFTAAEIGLFKGASSAGAITPSQRYHLAAQAAIPVLGAWQLAGTDRREMQHSRFQLDAPIVAGRPFFEMVAFFLDELSHIREVGYLEDTLHAEADSATRGPAQSRPAWEEFSSSRWDASGRLTEVPSRARYRKTSELYLAALLYYVNRFGDSELMSARRALFAWAYTPRMHLLRVQSASIDIHATDPAGAFALISRADDPSVVHRLAGPSQAVRADNEPRLRSFVAGRES